MTASELFNKYKKFKYDPDTFNCYTFVRYIYNDLGLYLPDYKYLLTGREAAFSKGAKTLLKEISSPEPWAIVLFKVRYEIDHIGVVTPTLVHFYHNIETTGVTKSSLKSKFWFPKIKGFYKYDNKNP